VDARFADLCPGECLFPRFALSVQLMALAVTSFSPHGHD
jgi:hypothetical protein